MAIKINKILNTKDGIQIPSGVVVGFETEFKSRSLQMIVRLFPWYNQAKYVDISVPCLGSPINEFKTYTLTKSLTEDDYTGLTPMAVHEWVKSQIESWEGIGSGQTEIV